MDETLVKNQLSENFDLTHRPGLGISLVPDLRPDLITI